MANQSTVECRVFEFESREDHWKAWQAVSRIYPTPRWWMASHRKDEEGGGWTPALTLLVAEELGDAMATRIVGEGIAFKQRTGLETVMDFERGTLTLEEEIALIEEGDEE